VQLKANEFCFLFFSEWISSHLIPLCCNNDADFVASAEKTLTPEYSKHHFRLPQLWSYVGYVPRGSRFFFFFFFAQKHDQRTGSVRFIIHILREMFHVQSLILISIY